MNFNKEVLINNFKNNNYSICIEMLLDEIIRILVSEIQIYDPKFTYTNITNLKTNCLQYLDLSKKEIILELYDIMYKEEYTDEFVLDSLLNMYERLSKNNLSK